MSLFDNPDNPLIMPVIVINDAESAVPLAEALLEGGLNWIEITLRTEAALESIKRIAKAVPEMRVGAGTVVTEELAQKAIDAGSTFGLAPGFSRKILRVFKMNEVPFIPGVCTPTEITVAMEHGYTKLKFFPAEPAGGAEYIKAANAPFKSYGMQYCPTGGLNLQNMADIPRPARGFHNRRFLVGVREADFKQGMGHHYRTDEGRACQGEGSPRLIRVSDPFPFIDPAAPMLIYLHYYPK